MALRSFDRIALALIGIFLGMIALRPFFASDVVAAQGDHSRFYVEPGTTTLYPPEKDRRVLGKVVIDLANGKIWGFPTLTELPYPIEDLKNTPPISHPMYLGQYDFAAMAVK